jgi:hypothetical protein
VTFFFPVLDGHTSLCKLDNGLGRVEFAKNTCPLHSSVIQVGQSGAGERLKLCAWDAFNSH